MTPKTNNPAPFFSVIIPVYNGLPYLSISLQSLLDQSLGDWEALVVDDQSTDATPQLVQDFQSRNPWARIEYFRMPFKKGISPGRVRNYGIGRARGQWISFLDHDDQWHPTRLEKHHKIIVSDPSVALIHSDEWLIDNTGAFLNDGRGRIESRPTLDPGSLSGNCFATLFHGNPIGMSCVSVKRAVLESVGAFDEEILSEDYDLWLRMSIGRNFHYIPEPLSRYRIHAGNISKKRIVILEGEARVISKICRSHPKAVAGLPPGARNARLFYLCRLLATNYQQASEPGKSRASLIRALIEKPSSLGTWARILLPGPLKPAD